MSKCKSFEPQINTKSKILILGSMPGIKSLEKQEYYAHPQNRFWKLAGMLCQVSDLYNFEYEKRIHTLLDNGYALWDVIKTCERTGSLDSDIQNEIPNKIPEILNTYKNIEIICMNGNKAYTAFKKYFPKLLQTYKCCKMPSTSPANAKFSLNDLYNIWYSEIDSISE